MTVDGTPTRTIAIESEDAAAVIAAVRSVGLGGYRNIELPGRPARRPRGSPPSATRSIDAGTNSIKFHVAERRRTAAWRTVVDRAEVTRLGEGLDRTRRDLGRRRPRAPRTPSPAWSRRPTSSAPRALVAVGTAGLRHRPQRRRRRRGDPGARPASRSRSSPARRRAASPISRSRRPRARATSPLVVFDTGGGSSQFTFGHGTRVDERFSVDVGAVRFTEQFGLDGAVATRRSTRRGRRSPPTSPARRHGRARRRSSAWAAR